jgi:hypothetical protein
MPPINKIPKNISQYISENQFQTIFPYAKASAAFTHDSQSFWRYSDFISAIKWMNSHPNKVYNNFGTDSDNDSVNLLEISAFLGNFHQETGDPSIEAPYPWSWPKVYKNGEYWEGFAGGALAIMEGCIAQPILGDASGISGDASGISGDASGISGDASGISGDDSGVAQLKTSTLTLSFTEKSVIKTPENTITGIVSNLITLNQPQFGLGTGTGNGVVFQAGLIGVSDDGTLWGDSPINNNVGEVLPTSLYKQSTTDRKYAALGPYSQYGGRGAIQLSYNYNYTECSIALFNDYRLVKYPNLITTTDRKFFLNKPYYFGFPGPNPDGNNQLPEFLLNTTPPARIMAWLVCFWFWMDVSRSGRVISCHQAMLQPYTIGITTVNAIINNQSGLIKGSWAYNKNLYFIRVCKILGVNSENTLVNPPHPLSLITQ